MTIHSWVFTIANTYTVICLYISAVVHGSFAVLYQYICFSVSGRMVLWLYRFNVWNGIVYIDNAQSMDTFIVRGHSAKCLLPARRYASAGYSDRNVSVCPSVTRRYCVKTKKASGMISSPSGSPETVVFWRQISSPNSKGFPPNGSLKQGSVGKIQRFSSFKRLYL